ncbi:MAG: hypothetical protein QF791_06860, partial [Nitrospinaceae bacterium]|nr:hypothetical protein [Nitrospinaceae bacterium]
PKNSFQLQRIYRIFFPRSLPFHFAFGGEGGFKKRNIRLLGAKLAGNPLTSAISRDRVEPSDFNAVSE